LPSIMVKRQYIIIMEVINSVFRKGGMASEN